MLSKIYGSLIDFRNFLYDGDILDAIKVDRPVLSVGNLTAGGSGKTPVVIDLLTKLVSAGKKPIVIARNYRALSKGAQEVVLGGAWGPSYYGDEAYLVKTQVPEVKVWTGPRKYETAQLALLESEKQNQIVDLLVIDDGFQHRELNRDFDLVLLDASADKSDWDLLPTGQMREDFNELRRADSIVLTKVNLAAPEMIKELRERIRQVRPDLFSPGAAIPSQEEIKESGDQIGELEYHWSLKNPFQDHERVFLVSGIAKPKSFLQTIQILGEAVNVEIVDHLVFADHHQYLLSEIDQIKKLKEEYGGTRVITTEKDAVKFKELGWEEPEYEVVRLQVHWRKESEALNEFLRKI